MNFEAASFSQPSGQPLARPTSSAMRTTRPAAPTARRHRRARLTSSRALQPRKVHQDAMVKERGGCRSGVDGDSDRNIRDSQRRGFLQASLWFIRPLRRRQPSLREVVPDQPGEGSIPLGGTGERWTRERGPRPFEADEAPQLVRQVQPRSERPVDPLLGLRSPVSGPTAPGRQPSATSRRRSAAAPAPASTMATAVSSASGGHVSASYGTRGTSAKGAPSRTASGRLNSGP